MSGCVTGVSDRLSGCVVWLGSLTAFLASLWLGVLTGCLAEVSERLSGSAPWQGFLAGHPCRFVC